MDTFDAMMNSTCDVLATDDTVGADGQPDQTISALKTIATGVPCRASVMSGGREFKQQKQAAISYTRVFMRPRAITEHNYLKINGEVYNILDVQNPGGMDHHYELICEVVRA